MKSYTDIEQSKKLTEILPLESADMFCADVFNKEKETHSYNFHILSTWGCNTFEELKDRENKFVSFTPVWSLAALLDVLPRFIEYKGDKYYLRFMKEYVEYANDEISITGRCLHTTGNDNLVDACYEMIIRLNELKMLRL